MAKNPFIPKFSFVPKTTTRRRPTGFGSLIRDYDKDGVPNIIDCAPRNPKKHGKKIKKFKRWIKSPRVAMVGIPLAFAGAGAAGGVITGQPLPAIVGAGVGAGVMGTAPALYVGLIKTLRGD